ncbi:MAG: carbonic anhydrase [Planctomycetaceae bacterium]
MDLVYRFDPFQPIQTLKVADSKAACAVLEEGNDRFVEIATRMQRRAIGGDAGEPLVIPVSPITLGLPLFSGAAPTQAPFALVLGCSDARVPTEAVFDLAFNNLFVVRIAGNVLGTECLGSIDYAARNLGDSLKVVVVLGHTGCGAVTAAVDGYLSLEDFVSIAFTHSLRSLVDRIQIAVRGAARALKKVGGNDIARHPRYRDVLVEAAVYLNSAVTAYDLNREIRALGVGTLPVVYSVYDLNRLRVRSLPAGPSHDPLADCAFQAAPERPEDFVGLGMQIAERALAHGSQPGGSSGVDWSAAGI